MDFEGSYEVLLPHKYIWSAYLWQWNDSPLKSFWNFQGNAFCFFFSKWKKHYNFTFDTFKMYYANLNLSSINKPYLRAVEYAISFFSISYLCLF